MPRHRNSNPYAKEFTDAEKKVAVLLARGLTNVEIARELGVSSKSTLIRIDNIYSKISGLDGLELPEEGSDSSTKTRRIAAAFLKAHPSLYEDVSN